MDLSSILGGLSGLGPGLSSIFGGMFNDSGRPYQQAGKEFGKYYGQAQQYQNPFYGAGTGAIGPYQQWLQGMGNPSQFINQIMGNYQQSPFARFQTQQGNRAIQNFGSASGLLGSTPLAQTGADYARNISSQDMNQYLQNALGVNTQYGQGLGNLMTGGQNAANQLSSLLSQLGQLQGGMAFGQAQGEQKDRSDIFSGIINLLTGGGGGGSYGGAQGSQGGQSGGGGGGLLSIISKMFQG